MPRANKQAAISKPANTTLVEMEFAFRLSPTAILCCGALPSDLSGKEQVSIEGVPVLKPYLAALLPQNANKILMLVRWPDGHAAPEIPTLCIENGAQTIHWTFRQPMMDEPQQFLQFIYELSEASLAKLLLLLIKFTTLEKNAISYPAFIQICLESRARLSPHGCNRPLLHWLHPTLCYIETDLPADGDYQGAFLLLTAPLGIIAGKIQALALSDLADNQRKYALIVYFPVDALTHVSHAQLSIMHKNRLIALAQPEGQMEVNMSAFITHLASYSEYARLCVRDFIIGEILALDCTDEQLNRKALVLALQSFLLPAHTCLSDPQLPVGMNVEYFIPLEKKGIFIAGWLHDPLRMVEEITLLSDLGSKQSILSEMRFYPRHDVAEIFAGGPYPVHAHDVGFTAFIEYSQTLQAKWPDWVNALSVRLQVSLTSGMRYTLAPRPLAQNAKQSLQLLLEHVLPSLNPDSVAAYAAQKTCSLLQARASTETYIKRSEFFGTPVNNPIASVVIPLYQTLDYLSCQLASFSGDSAMQNAEIIYVLDSPDQERRVVEILSSLIPIYNISVRLLVLSKNAGYATATNIGAHAAHAPYVLLLNSDVVPTRHGWLAGMLAFYEQQDNAGAVAPKLLYEDDSLQHAGLYFAKSNRGDFYENLHYFKGYPATYPDAQVSREVPAVTGACMLMKKDTFLHAGGLSTDYVIGDFEDSDLCLRLYANGYRHFYLASETLYHFERQSMNHTHASHLARYHINARLQSARWSELLPHVVQAYENT